MHQIRPTRHQVEAASVAALGAAGIVWYAVTRKRVTAEERELARRTLLARDGRIIDGSITGIDGSSEDALPDLPATAPSTIIYRYRIAGVTYECGQDVSQLAPHVSHLRLDLPVQVRYDPANPGDSIVVAEHWSGLQQDAEGIN